MTTVAFATDDLLSPVPNCCLDIDMLTPTEVLVQLDLDEAALVALVNTARLPAYRIGGHLRFRANQVEALVSDRAAA